MKKLIKLSVIFFFIFINPIFSKNLNDIKMFTDDYPPFSYIEKGKLKGIAVEILDLILKNIGSDLNSKNVDLLYWTDAYDIVLKVPNSMLFVMTKTKERENIFKWVGPVAPLRQVIFAKKGSGIEIESYEDLKKYKIGVVKDYGSSKTLLLNGIDIKNIVYSYTEKENLFRFYKDEIKLISADVYNYGGYKNSIFLPEELEEVFVMNESHLYYAFNEKTSNDIIKIFQNSYDELKKNGLIKIINDNYLR